MDDFLKEYVLMYRTRYKRDTIGGEYCLLRLSPLQYKNWEVEVNGGKPRENFVMGEWVYVGRSFITYDSDSSSGFAYDDTSSTFINGEQGIKYAVNEYEKLIELFS